MLARLALFIYILGSASLKLGLTRLAGVFRKSQHRTEVLKLAFANFKRKWPILLLNLAVYLLIARGINVLIDQLAYETCLYLTMQNRLYAYPKPLNGQSYSFSKTSLSSR